MKIKLLDIDSANKLHFVVMNENGVESNVLSYSNVFYQDLKKLTSLNIGFHAVSQSDQFSVMEKNRLQIIKANLVYPA